MLVPHTDPLYHRAIDHFQHTRQLVTASLAPDEDQAMFLQAEALFRYRFVTPEHGFGSYVATITGAITNLPVFESLAGSLDLYGLRLKTSDGAAQIWETLLERHPTTPLRALALYRLGWVYRNSLSAGLPRDSDTAFDDADKCCHDSPIAPFAAKAKHTDWKSMGTATAWSVVPGLGQMYVGEYGNGTLRLAIALISGAMIVVPAVIALERRNSLTWANDWPLVVSAFAGANIIAVDYSNSYQDAMRAVLEYNERTELEFENAHPDAP